MVFFNMSTLLDSKPNFGGKWDGPSESTRSWIKKDALLDRMSRFKKLNDKNYQFCHQYFVTNIGFFLWIGSWVKISCHINHQWSDLEWCISIFSRNRIRRWIWTCQIFCVTIKSLISCPWNPFRTLFICLLFILLKIWDDEKSASTTARLAALLSCVLPRCRACPLTLTVKVCTKEFDCPSISSSKTNGFSFSVDFIVKYSEFDSYPM